MTPKMICKYQCDGLTLSIVRQSDGTHHFRRQWADARGARERATVELTRQSAHNMMMEEISNREVRQCA